MWQGTLLNRKQCKQFENTALKSKLTYATISQSKVRAFDAVTRRRFRPGADTKSRNRNASAASTELPGTR